MNVESKSFLAEAFSNGPLYWTIKLEIILLTPLYTVGQKRTKTVMIHFWLGKRQNYFVHPSEEKYQFRLQYFVLRIPVDLRYSLSCIAVATDVPGVRQLLWEKYVMEIDPKERTRLLSSLGCSSDKAFLSK